MKDQKENRNELVDALQSGEYQQGRGRLKRKLPDGNFIYCPLGIACEIYHNYHIGFSRWCADTTYSTGFKGVKNGGIHYQFPPSVVEEFFGFSKNNVENIITMNDLNFATFNEISTWIENLNEEKNVNT